ncbi:MAG: hypothetical protein QNJ05_00410 [Woeseiaceae bacterium]|nr:hypothetical protein [Woeseiaceae bacterium]
MTRGRRSGRPRRRLASWLCLVVAVLATVLVVAEPTADPSVSTSTLPSMAGGTASCDLAGIELRDTGWPRIALTFFQQARVCGWQRTLAFFAVDWVTRRDERGTKARPESGG